jgi:hypothetical protein
MSATSTTWHVVATNVSTTAGTQPANETSISLPEGWELSDEECLRVVTDWHSTIRKMHMMTQSVAVGSDTIVLESYRRVGSGTTYTMCDGLPRFRFDQNAHITTEIVSITLSHYTTRSYFPDASDLGLSRTPPCNLTGRSICTSLRSQYESEVLASTRSFGLPQGAGLLGCLPPGCEVSIDDDVVLFYWPPKVIDRDICAPDGIGRGVTVSPTGGGQSTVTISAITFAGQDLYTRLWVGFNSTTERSTRTVSSSVMHGSWTFISPTVYLAHRPISAASGVFFTDGIETLFMPDKATQIRPAGVMTLRSDDVYTRRLLFPTENGVARARQIAAGTFDWTRTALFETRPLDFGHLANLFRRQRITTQGTTA